MLLKVVVALAALNFCSSAPVTQEELAQYVARQQTAGYVGVPRRQAYVLQPQPKAVYQPQPKEQVYQIQPKASAQAYQIPAKQYYQPQADQQYYQPQVQQYYQSQPGKKLVRPISGQQQLEEQEDYDPNPQYQFGFDIKYDEFTNYQNRKEQREGDKISGSYSVVDSDGYIRTVKYTADPLEGFKADVVREPTDIKVKIPQPQPAQEQYPQQYNVAARKQQTQQYLQSSPPLHKQQVILRPEHTQAYAGSPSQVRQYAAYAQQQGSPKAYAQQPSSPVLYQYQQ